MKVDRSFRGTYDRHLQGRRLSQARYLAASFMLFSFSAHSSTLKMETFVPLKRRLTFTGLTKTKLRGRSPQANYTDRATAACRRS
jgi:hypothetical protein